MRKHKTLNVLAKIAFVILAIVIIFCSTACAQAGPANDPITAQYAEYTGNWTITKIHPISANHFLFTLHGEERGCVVDVNRTDEYILYNIGDIVEGILTTETTHSGSFRFLGTNHLYSIIGHVRLPENNSN